MKEQKENKDKESIQQQPDREKKGGIHTPEPPQVKDPRRLPDSDEETAEKDRPADDQQPESSRKG